MTLARNEPSWIDLFSTPLGADGFGAVGVVCVTATTFTIAGPLSLYRAAHSDPAATLLAPTRMRLVTLRVVG
jgi:hypothetical protein